MRLILVVALLAACSKEPTLGGRKLTVPPGCKATHHFGSEEITCADHSQLMFQGREGEYDPLVRAERQAREVLRGRIEKERPPCRIAGTNAECIRLRVHYGKSTAVALLGEVELQSRLYFVGCSFDEVVGDEAPVCNDLFEFR
jgi:hypothetical protein